MKKFTHFLLLISFAFFLYACDSNQEYREYQKLDKEQWTKTSNNSFTVKIENSDINYDLGLSLRYNTAVKHQTFQAKVIMTDPSGASTEKNVSLERSEAEEAGSYGDIDTIFAENVILQKGEYTFKVLQAMEPDAVGGIMKVGVFVNKVEK